jgi:hypothetical protein
MGNTFAKNNNDNNNDNNDTINWNSIKTEKVGGNLLSNDSKLLLNRLELNIPNNEETEVISEVDNIFSKYQHVNNEHVVKEKTENELSDTSPFISSEMYNLLMKPELKNSNITQQKGGKIDGDDSSTSSTSSSGSSSNDESSSEEIKTNKKKNKKVKGTHKNKLSSTIKNETSRSNETTEYTNLNEKIRK